MHQTELPRNQSAPEEGSLNGSVLAASSPDASARTRSYAWDDPAISAAAAREQDGMAFLQAIIDGSLPGAPIAHTLDFTPVSVQPGSIVFEFTPAEFHYNPIGSVHGGMYLGNVRLGLWLRGAELAPGRDLLHEPGSQREVLARGELKHRPADVHRHGHSPGRPLRAGGSATDWQ